ncbi:LacI family transcriptional regulator [Mycetocola manganoxydans]|uniref:LacI family transcriptional regulator n=1 Tax=Mycetocola manganoxydans TaxID=699879 RepID=A0A3L6ZUI1_9MICO|nr:LacI family DNA-binding transcriptional regulator [Mycetocola manganoxydans]RLP71468.1 LacI family transcriptional regulator [Mycetocola manganoxydans]GHD46664.1 transcriptional regulator [Mycetocola manganoxydans]
MNRDRAASGDRTEARPTLAAVASRAGVSPSTASLAFSGHGPVSDDTRAKVLAAAAELGYGGPDPLAQSLRRGRSGIIGALIPARIGVSFRDPVLIQTLDGLAEEISAIGAGLLLIPDVSDGQLSVKDAPVDAVVLVGCNVDTISTLDLLRRRNIPMVQIEGEEDAAVHTIGVDNRGGVRLLAEHLRELGHTRAAIITLPIDRDSTPGPLTAEREAAATVRATLERIAGARSVFPGIGGRIASGSRSDAGREAALVLLDVPPADRPTAILAQSDLLAAGVLAAAEELGLRVPEDLSVVGFDGIRVEGLERSLTTVWQPSQGKGAAAGRAIVEMLAGGSPEPVTFDVRFQPGDTTGPAPS